MQRKLGNGVNHMNIYETMITRRKIWDRASWMGDLPNRHVYVDVADAHDAHEPGFSALFSISDCDSSCDRAQLAISKMLSSPVSSSHQITD